MKSPFMGMDPYIEDPDIWGDFHSSLAYELRHQLNTQIQPHYFATIETKVVYDTIEIGQKEKYLIYPDVDIRQGYPAPGSVLTLEPKTMIAPIESRIAYEEPRKLYRVEIRAVNDRDLVTVIEILAPVTKKPQAQAYKDYLRKRLHLLRSFVHLLEIDLLRSGTRPPLEQAVPKAPYYIMLSREHQRPRVMVWPIQLAQALPTVPVPLRDPDPDAMLNLELALATIYQNGAYSLRINYQQPVPAPTLSPQEQTWVDNLLADYK